MNKRDCSFDKDLHGNITTFGPFICLVDHSQKSSPRKLKQIKTQSGLNLSTYMTSYLFIFWCGKHIYITFAKDGTRRPRRNKWSSVSTVFLFLKDKFYTIKSSD